MKQNIVGSITTIVLGCFLLAYIGFQAYNSFYNPVSTVSAVYVDVDDAIELDGYVVRNESVMIRNYGAGVLEMSVDEGERVANGSVVAVVYADENSAMKSHELSDLDDKISLMATLYAQSGENYDIEAANDKISEYSAAIVKKQNESIYNGMTDLIEDLKLQTMVREYIYSDKAELLDAINELKAQRSELASQTVVNKRIYSNKAGYFSQQSDGYETVLDSELIMNATPGEFLDTCNQYAAPDQNAMGKLVGSNIWYYAAVVDEKLAANINKGKDMKIKFQDKTLPDVVGEVIRISDVEDGKVLVVFECNTHIGYFTKVRRVTARAVIKTYSGLKVPREALRVDAEGQNGVYCLIDSQVKFKPIEIIFEKDSYYVSSYDTSDTKSLLLYDEIVVSAKNLENKKMVK